MDGESKKSRVLPASKTVNGTILSGGLKAMSIGLLGLLIVSIIILSYVPPVSRDALTHHLIVPRLYLQQGSIYEIPSIMSLLKWIENRYQLKFLILAATYCGLALGTKYNGLIVLFILTIFIPFIFINNYKKNFNLEKAGGKGNLIKIQFKALGYGAIFFTIALLVFSPWMIRNYAWKANPIYPLYDNVFNRQIPVSPDAQTGSQTLGAGADPQQTSKTKSTPWSSFALRKIVYGESLWEIALIPVRIFFQGQDDNPKYFDGKLNPFLFFLPFFAFIHLKKDPASLRTEKIIFIFFTILLILFSFLTTSIRIRYVAPIIPPLIILAILGMHQIARLITNRKVTKAAWIGSGFIIVMVTIMLSLNASYILKQFRYVDPFSYISGRVSRDTYIAKYRPEHSIYQYANQNLPENVKILGLFLGNRRYYSDRELFFGVGKFKKIIGRVDSVVILIKSRPFNNDKAFVNSE